MLNRIFEGGASKKRVRVGALRGRTLAFKNAVRIFLANWRLPSGAGLAFRSLAFKTAFLCVCVVKPTSVSPPNCRLHFVLGISP